MRVLSVCARTLVRPPGFHGSSFIKTPILMQSQTLSPVGYGGGGNGNAPVYRPTSFNAPIAYWSVWIHSLKIKIIESNIFFSLTTTFEDPTFAFCGADDDG
jgi:hypothetical protein